MQFTHLHCHTQYSLLDGAASISGLMKKAKADGMRAVALTDHGNMFGAFEFVQEAKKQDVKPIIGCEFYLVQDRSVRSFTKDKRDVRYHQLLLAKNQTGYKNLSKLCSLGYIEGLYGKYPRIDKEILMQYKEGLIATTCCIGAEVPQTILHKGPEEGERVFKEWLDIFGHENYFIELQRHNLQNLDGSGMSQEDINQVLIGFSKKYDVKIIATNDSHYVNEEDSNAHDILLCVNTGEKQATPKMSSEQTDKKGFRFGFPNSQFFFKTQAEMEHIFADIPEALDNTNIIVDAIETPRLDRDVLLPNYTLPEGFKTQAEYLTFLAYEGAKRRYGVISLEVEERLQFELNTIINSGYPGYFLIVQDFTSAAREMNVWVGPGRGSAAGSVVAYCLGITNVDPIKYNLLFERFLNPERVSMPDIDIDFDDRGRDKVIDYVVKKYGQRQVAQIITYGTMAAKSSIRDVGRVLDVPLSEVDRVSKLVPDGGGVSLDKILTDEKFEKLKGDLNSEQKQKADEFRKIAHGGGVLEQMLTNAKKLEGSVRNTGIHACGIIITPEDITNIIPVTTAKDSDLLVTQFDNSVVEKAGLLKMDFLGLRTLTILKDAIELVKERHGINIVPEDIPLDDAKTYELFQRAETNGIFQFESAGMQKYLRMMRPDKFEDLIAMNALYRPGPMEYIPNYCKRKHGEEAISYDFPIMEEILKETYGITVYQEQVMLLSQTMAGFSKGQADVLRKAMGKKDKATMDKMYTAFVEGCTANNLEEKIVAKVWKDWEAFAQYAFNKSHATCYAYIAFHTAYLKAHYPAEFMAAVLTHNMSNIENINFFLTECKRLGLKILGPDVNESAVNFTVNRQGAIRFALSALKGVGEAAVEELVRERKEHGEFSSIFDFVQRVNLRVVNKKSIESMALGGAFDGFKDFHRAQYFSDSGDGSFIEKLIRFGNKAQDAAFNTTASLFGESAPMELAMPKPAACEEWSLVEKLNKEQDVTGIFVSGHPLDNFKKEMDSFLTCTLGEITQNIGKDILVAGMITKSHVAYSKAGKKYAKFTVQDFNSSFEFWAFGEDCLKYEHFINQIGLSIAIKGRYQKTVDRNQNEREEFKLQEVFLLDSLKEKYAKFLSVNLLIQEVNAPLIAEIENLVKKHTGDMAFRVHFIDTENQKKVTMQSSKLRVDASAELIMALETLIPNPVLLERG